MILFPSTFLFVFSFLFLVHLDFVFTWVITSASLHFTDTSLTIQSLCYQLLTHYRTFIPLINKLSFLLASLLLSFVTMTERSDQAMEAASNPSSLETFVNTSIQRMDHQEKNLNDTARAVQAPVTQVSELTQQLQLCEVPLRHPHWPFPPHHRRMLPSQSRAFPYLRPMQVSQVFAERF